MGAFKNLITTDDQQQMQYVCDAIAQARDELRIENQRLREENAKLASMAEQYLMALLTRAINEVSND